MQLSYETDGASRHLFWMGPNVKKSATLFTWLAGEKRKFTREGLLIQLPRVTYLQLIACKVTKAADTESHNHDYRKAKC